MMKNISEYKLVYKVDDRCRVCYTCVRECPAKAIKIINGQADVISERCISCGNCVKVCSQGAKAYRFETAQVIDLLNSGEKIIACVAPSFPAEFTDFEDYRKFVGALRALGFWKVTEVSFGADIVADRYSKLLDENPDRVFISSDCPSIVSYVEHYHTDLIDNLVPLCSPMVASVRILKEVYGSDAKFVFIGPCVAKKAESDELDATITFRELREIFEDLKMEQIEASDFDPPHSAKGAIFPVSRGMLNTMGKSDDFGISKIQVADGTNNFRDAIQELEDGNLKVNYLELLCCQGCISGAGMTSCDSRFKKRSYINNYVAEKFKKTDFDAWEKEKSRFEHVDLSRKFHPQPVEVVEEVNDKIGAILEEMGKTKKEDLLNCGACGYETCIEHAIAISNGLAEEEMCLPFTIDKLHGYIGELNTTNERLASTKEALKQSEKLAHMGQLSAGIAHELNNPLGVITMYSNILIDESDENDPVREDLELIVEQANRCKKIVGGLLNFARKNQVVLDQTNIIAFCNHCLKSVIVPKNIKTEVVADVDDPTVYLDHDQMIQVLTNLEKNAFEAMSKGGQFKIHISDKENPNEIHLSISDTGSGIAKENQEKIFTPFFTTKGISKGTGLGLPLVYGIIKMHKGRISLKTNNDKTQGPTGTTFNIVLPRRPQDVKVITK